MRAQITIMFHNTMMWWEKIECTMEPHRKEIYPRLHTLKMHLPGISTIKIRLEKLIGAIKEGNEAWWVV